MFVDFGRTTLDNSRPYTLCIHLTMHIVVVDINLHHIFYTFINSTYIIIPSIITNKQT